MIWWSTYTQRVSSCTMVRRPSYECVQSLDSSCTGNLIVRVHNHKSTTTSSPANSKGSASDRSVPFSIHNYNEHLTPSPFVPYPTSNTDQKSSGEVISANGTLSEANKENYPTQKKPSSGSAVTTTVLFPTPRSQQEELRVLANTVDPRAPNRKHSQAGSSSRTPASATLPHPSTPLFATQPTASNSGPPAKKQKMMVSGTDIPRVQSLMINATAPPICLDVVSDRQEADRLLRDLTDSYHQESLPPPKTRKRTVAELAVDEAIAAEEQRFMLIMDERLVNTTSAATANVADGESGAASFEPRFERFKLLESIKAAHEQKAEEDRLAKQHAAQQAQANAFTARQEMAERAEREKAQREQQARVAAEHAKREAVRQQYQAQQERLAMQQQQHLANQAQHAHPQTTTAMVPNTQQHMAPTSHPPQSSPLLRNMTPHNNSSPVVGNMVPPQPAQAIPMRVTSSSQGGSPARPPSSLQQPHPKVAATMARQRSQQGSSQGGTPHMPNSTPNLMQTTPVTRHVTPTPRLSHASPVNPVLSQTPVMNQVGPGMPPQLTPHQQQHMFMQQQRLRHQQMQNSPPNNQMSAHNMQQAVAIAAQQRHFQQQEAYRSSIMNQTQLQLAGLQGSPNPNQRMPAPPPHGHPPANGAPRQISHQQRAMQEMQHKFYNRAMQTVQQKFGMNPPPQEIQNARNQALAQTQAWFNQRVQQQRQQQVLAQAQMAQMNGNPGMMGMGQGQMGGMSGM